MYERECPDCGFKTDEDICLNCGATVKPSVYVVKAPSGIPVIPPSNLCPGCNNIITEGKKFCAVCGYKVGRTIDNKISHDNPYPYHPDRKTGKAGNNIQNNIILSIILITVIAMFLIVFVVSRNQSSSVSSHTDDNNHSSLSPSVEPAERPTEKPVKSVPVNTPVPATFSEEKLKDEVIETIYQWKDDWQSLSFNEYMSHYAGDFHSSKEHRHNYRELQADRKRLFDVYNRISIDIRNIQFVEIFNSSKVKVKFYQYFNVLEPEEYKYKDKGIQTLIMEKHNGEWFINQEEFELDNS